MARCLVSFGANIGDAWSTIRSAADKLQGLLCEGDRSSSSERTSFQLSRCFRTPPVGGPAGQPPFINAVAAINTPASPWEVWNSVRSVEKEFGRERNLRWEARRIDLDILLYDDVRIWTPHLKIPHPRMCMRRFILLPAVDVAQDWVDPVSTWTIGQLADNVRQGPSNFVLLAEESSKPESLLAEVARRANAKWRFTTQTGHRSEPWADGRWVSVAPKLSDIRGELAASKLLIVHAPKVIVTDVAWEDYHRELASRMGLHGSVSTFAPGPRYLLASDDPEWAVQELVAALEAMDCPIEPLS